MFDSKTPQMGSSSVGLQRYVREKISRQEEINKQQRQNWSIVEQGLQRSLEWAQYSRSRQDEINDEQQQINNEQRQVNHEQRQRNDEQLEINFQRQSDIERLVARHARLEECVANGADDHEIDLNALSSRVQTLEDQETRYNTESALKELFARVYALEEDNKNLKEHLKTQNGIIEALSSRHEALIKDTKLKEEVLFSNVMVAR